MIWVMVLLAHLVGDYIIQSDWMANEKTKRWWPAIAHGVTYTLPYLLVTRSISALLVIGGTHVIIDHYRLARHLAWVKNQVAPARYRSSWEESKATGYAPSTPAWLAVWLMIITDNTLHLIINIAAVYWLGGVT